jgi:hypothetical protein
MVRLLGRCLPIICLSRKKRQSLPICGQQTAGTKHHQDEINKLFVRRVESIRVTQQGAVLKRLPIQTINERHQQHKKTFELIIYFIIYLLFFSDLENLKLQVRKLLNLMILNLIVKHIYLIDKLNKKIV